MARKILTLLLTGLLIPPIRAQLPPDTLFINYDSIQDSRVDRLERRLGWDLELLEDSLYRFAIVVDSLEDVIKSLTLEMEQLERARQLQAAALSALEEKHRAHAAAAEQDREKNRKIQLVAGIALLLIAGVLVFTLVYSVRTRRLFMDRLRRFMEKTGRRLEKVTRRQRKLRRRVRKRDETLREEIKKERKVLRKEIRKRTGFRKKGS